jgi:NAD-dependent DNA ligase
MALYIWRTEMELFDLAVNNGDALIVTNDVKGMRFEFITLNKKEDKQRRVCRLFTPEGGVIENPWKQKTISDSAKLLVRMISSNSDWVASVEPRTVEGAHDTWNAGGRCSDKSILNRMEVDNVSGKVVCITGGIITGLTRRQAAAELEKAGAIVVKNISKKVDLVLVAGLADVRWKYKRFGMKVAKAINLQTGGHPIELVDAEATLKSIAC